MSRRSGDQQRRRTRSSPRPPVDLWRPVGAPPHAAPIEPATDPTALIRSLGDPPLGQSSIAAAHHLAAVAERASALASALAVSAGLLAEPGTDEL